MILDNLRRTLVPVALLTAFFLGWFVAPNTALPWTAMLVIVFLLPDFLRSMWAMAVKPRHLSWSVYLPSAGLGIDSTCPSSALSAPMSSVRITTGLPRMRRATSR